VSTGVHDEARLRGLAQRIRLVHLTRRKPRQTKSSQQGDLKDPDF
jgi:hypothetical protein